MVWVVAWRGVPRPHVRHRLDASIQAYQILVIHPNVIPFASHLRNLFYFLFFFFILILWVVFKMHFEAVYSSSLK